MWDPHLTLFLPRVAVFCHRLDARADVIDAIFEVSSGPTEAVSALAGMFPPESAPADVRSNSNGGGEGADQPSTTATQSAADAVLLASIRHARTLEDMQAQRGPPSSPTAAAPSTAAAEEDKANSPGSKESSSSPKATAPSTAAAEEDEAESPGAEEAGPEAEVAPASGGVDDSIPSSSITELEKVAAFIASYAGAHLG